MSFHILKLLHDLFLKEFLDSIKKITNPNIQIRVGRIEYKRIKIIGNDRDLQILLLLLEWICNFFSNELNGFGIWNGKKYEILRMR